MKTDIQDYKDVYIVITNFYKKGSEDDLLGPIFKSRITSEHWDEHMETISQFWCGILFQTGNYAGRPFPKHATMGLSPKHFERWLSLFHETITEYYQGPKADQMNTTSTNIANMFSARIEYMKQNPNMFQII
jgi:hemoglobin